MSPTFSGGTLTGTRLIRGIARIQLVVAPVLGLFALNRLLVIRLGEQLLRDDPELVPPAPGISTSTHTGWHALGLAVCVFGWVLAIVTRRITASGPPGEPRRTLLWAALALTISGEVVTVLWGDLGILGLRVS